MADYSAKDVQRLRQAAGAGMMDAKRALDETGGDFDAAIRWLREKGIGDAGKRVDRENEQGSIAAANTGQAAALVELKSETDFVAKSPDFVGLVDDLAAAVAERGEKAVEEYSEQLTQLVSSLKENIEVGRVVRYEASDGSVLDTYLHVQNERGVNGVLVELKGGDRALAHEIALHIASSRPRYLRRDEVPAAVVDEEREVLEAKTRNEGKPDNAIGKIVEGRLNGFYKEICLLEQGFVKDPKQSVQQLLGNAEVARFAQLEIGR
jgi:elongation factor Ts